MSAAAQKRWRERHPETVRAQKKLYYQRHRDRLRERMNPANLARSRRLRQEIPGALGGECVHCGFGDWRALQVDHVNGGGRKDRRRFLNKAQFLRAVLASPGLYQLLCANCNWIKRYEQHEYRWRSVAVTTSS
jgi:hypothetical protein